MKKVFLLFALVAFVGAVQAKPVEKKSTEQSQAIATSYEHSSL
ncbi:MAG TPA: hypothetical protein VL728_19545 [Cyclobacteriaceae bacterium]|jgi:hypothetical protein|nr:hypothetical protein [Cyclobacteriaceae bacterium]